MATTADIEYVCRVIESQGMRRMEATEAGTDGLKIDYLEGTAVEISERVRDLSASIRGMFVVRCWSAETPHDKVGRKSPKSAPFTWRIMGNAGSGPVAAIQEKIVERNLSESEKDLIVLRARLDMQEQEFRHRMEMNALEDLEQPEVLPAPLISDAHIDRLLGFAERIMDRLSPIRKASQSAPINGIQPTDELEKIICAMERFRAADPAQYDAIKAELLKQYGGEEPPKADGQ